MDIRTIGGTKRRIFISFDSERDRPVRDYFYNQGRRDDATWIVKSWSEPFADDSTGMWISQTTGRIKQAEVVVVLLGPTAFRCPGVLKEVTIAQMLGKRIYQIIPHGGGSPNVIPNAGRVLRWEWDNIKRAIAASPARWNTARQVRL
ncbi:MAG: hypothetical protein O2826_00130 [Chloroflexi bacterium]|nr:hypothetical protein [Chloroflexota bacterium]MDA1172917.1 hypothetical protein [Chloroflexota bacterium]